MAKLISEQKVEEACPGCGGEIMESHYKKFIGSKIELKCQNCGSKWKNKDDLKNIILRAKREAERKAELTNALENKELPTIVQLDSSIILKKNEQMHCSSDATLFEERKKRKHHRGQKGVRLAKGLYVGGTKGYSESYSVIEPVDEGVLALTSQKLIFNGDKYNRTFPLKKIASLELYKDGVEIGIENRNKVQIFKVGDPERWNVFIRVAIERQDN